jgi:hypothetical protein
MNEASKEHLEIISLATKYYGLEHMPFEEGLKVIEQHLDLSEPKKALNELQLLVATFGTKEIEDSYNAYCDEHRRE